MQNIRILLAYGSEDEWIARVARDVAVCAKDMGIEFFALGQAGRSGIPKPVYLDINTLVNKFPAYILGTSHISAAICSPDNISLERKFRGGNSVDTDAKISEDIQRWANTIALVYKTVQPDLVIVWNGLLHKRKVYAQVAKQLHIPILYAEKGVLPGSWGLDPFGVNALSIPANRNTFPPINHDEFLKYISNIASSGVSAWEQPKRRDATELRTRLGLPTDRAIVFFPGQIDDDSNILLFSNHFDNCFSAVKWLAEGLRGSKYYLVVKPHPKGKKSLNEYRRLLRGIGQVVGDINVYDAIDMSSCIVSVNSSVAFEAAISGKPVVLLGKGILSGKSFICEYENLPSALLIAKAISQYTDESRREALGFASWLHKEYYCHLGDISHTKDVLKRLFEKVSIGNKTFSAGEIECLFQTSNSATIAAGLLKVKGRVKRFLSK